ncbi:MAG: hypothetical protein Hens2KO_07500 [Henriciella sp.]
MRKSLATIAAIAAFSAPFAQADTSQLTVGMSYDPVLLQSEDGAKEVLASLEAQASEACSYDSPILGTPKVDATCRDELVKKSIDAIRLASLQDGTQAAYVFASRDLDAETPAQ